MKRPCSRASAVLATVATACAALLTGAPAMAQQTSVAIGISGWTGFAPLTLAPKRPASSRRTASMSTIKKIPQKDRHLAIASGDIQCAATTVETWIVWNANGVATTQIFQLDKSYGADGMVVAQRRQDDRRPQGQDRRGVGAPAPRPYFTLAWMLKKNGLSVKDVKVVNMEPSPAAQAFVAGQRTRRGDDLRTLPVDGAREARCRQDHRNDARLPDGHGHLRLHAEVHQGQSEGRARRWPTATSRRST